MYWSTMLTILQPRVMAVEYKWHQRPGPGDGPVSLGLGTEEAERGGGSRVGARNPVDWNWDMY